MTDVVAPTNLRQSFASIATQESLCYLVRRHTGGVTGSIPVAPTICIILKSLSY
jgi:hypothetical protein